METKNKPKKTAMMIKKLLARVWNKTKRKCQRRHTRKSKLSKNTESVSDVKKIMFRTNEMYTSFLALLDKNYYTIAIIVTFILIQWNIFYRNLPPTFDTSNIGKYNRTTEVCSG